VSDTSDRDIGDRDSTDGDNTDGDSGNRHTADRAAGDVIVFADVIGTFAFVVTAVTAAVVFSTASQWVGAITAMALFAVGVFAFIWSFFNAVQRSREEQISVTQVYLLLGSPTPARVRRIMLSMLVVQTVVGLATAIARSEAEDGSPGTSLAVGVLVPMFGIGLNGLWCAFHGVFPPRPDVVTFDAEIDKNG
jgi:hypothetical protein